MDVSRMGAARLFSLAERLEWPNCPPWDQRHKMLIAHNDAALIFGNP